MNGSNARKPDQEFRIGGVSCAVWCEEVEQDGRTQKRTSFKLNKRYRDKDGNWQDSGTLFPEDIHKARTVLQQAYEFAMLREREQDGDSVAA